MLTLVKRCFDDRNAIKALVQTVICHQTKSKKIWSKKHQLYDSEPLVATAIKGSMVTAIGRNGREIVRDASWFKRCTSGALIRSPLEVGRSSSQVGTEPQLTSDRLGEKQHRSSRWG